MYKFVLVSLLLLPLSLFAQPHNLQIAASLADSLVLRLPLHSDTARISTSPTDAQMIILQAIARRLPVKLVPTTTDASVSLYLSPAVFSVDYSPISKNEIKRTISVSLTIQKSTSQVLSQPATFVLSWSDTLSYAKAEQINASSPDFLRNQLPATEESSWEQFLRPAIVVATLAATVWLFFSVRSR